MEHLEKVGISAEVLARWHEAAKRLGDAGGVLRTELADVARDPSRHMLRRAAKSARFAERRTAGLDQQIANAVATEIENAAEGHSLT